MVFGHSDYGLSQGRKIIHPVTDWGELALRLNSPNAYQRSGNVVLMDNFEHGLEKWSSLVIGGSGSFDLSQDSAKTGFYSGKIITDTYFPTIVRIQRGVGLLNLGRLGLEISLASPDRNFILDAYLYLLSGSRWYQAGLRVNCYTNRLYLFDPDVNWVLVDSAIGAKWSGYIYNTIKLVADFSLARYAHLFFNERSYNVSDQAFFNVASSALPYVAMRFEGSNPSTVAAVGYLDDVILTQNEI